MTNSVMLTHYFKIILTLSTNCLIVALILAFGSLEIKDTNLVAFMIGGVILEWQYNFASMLTLSLSIISLKSFRHNRKLFYCFNVDCYKYEN